MFLQRSEESLIFMPFSCVDPIQDFSNDESRRQQVTCSSILSRGIVFPFSGTNFLRDRHRDARYRMSQPSLGTLTLPHTNFSYSICWPFWDPFLSFCVFLSMRSFFQYFNNNSVLMRIIIANYFILEWLDNILFSHVCVTLCYVWLMLI